jgi:hypothetical protein
MQNGVQKTIRSFCLLSNNGWIKFPSGMLFSYSLKEIFCDDALQDSIGLPLGTIAKIGMWVFDPTTYRHTMDDIKYGNNIIRAIVPLGGIGFVFYCPEGEHSTMKF